MRTRTYKFSKSQFQRLKKIAVEATKYDGKEVCGFLVDNGVFLELVQARNKTNRGGDFSYYSGEVESLKKAVSRINHEIVGTYHSHPAYIAKPGESDIQNAINNSLMLVINCMDKEAGLWEIREGKAIKLKFELI